MYTWVTIIAITNIFRKKSNHLLLLGFKSSILHDRMILLSRYGCVFYVHWSQTNASSEAKINQLNGLSFISWVFSWYLFLGTLTSVLELYYFAFMRQVIFVVFLGDFPLYLMALYSQSVDHTYLYSILSSVLFLSAAPVLSGHFSVSVIKPDRSFTVMSVGEHETFSLFCFNAGPASQTVDQH